MVEVALIALLSVVAGIAVAVVRVRDPGPTAFWLAASSAIFGAGVCYLLLGQFRWILIPGYALAGLYPALLLAGALAHTDRTVPAWLVPLGLGVGAVRALAVEIALPTLAQGIALTFQPTAILLAAALVYRMPRSDPSPFAQRALAPALVAVAALEATTLLATQPGAAIGYGLLRLWVPVVPLMLTIQVAAVSDRAHRELRQARDRLEQRVAERTAELSRSLAALREAEERYRTVSELSSDYSFDVRIAPDFSVDFEWVTAALTQISGYQAEDLEGERWLSLVPPDDRRVVLERLRAVMAGEADEMEVRIISRVGEPRWLAVRFGTRRREADGSLRIVGAGRDVTELKRGEEERRRLDAILRQRQRVESLGLLAGGIAHDFNNVLTVIRGNAQLALGDLDAASPARERLARIQAVSEYASELTAQMLTYSGRASLALRPLDLSQLVRDALDLMRASIAQKNTLDVDLAEGLPAVRGDTTQLRQVLLNLVGNASEATLPEGGSIEVRTGLRPLGAKELASSFPTVDAVPGDYVYLEVSDSGPGIDDELKARIFEPFFTTKASGRGLGLAAVFGIVSAHGGVIDIETAPGEGTAVRALFPTIPTAPQS